MTSSAKHCVLTDSRLSGFEYGMLRDFESEIVAHTGAQLLEVPRPRLPKLVKRYTEPTSRYAVLGKLVPRQALQLSADTLWLVLMGPESYPFWFFKDWARNVGKTVLYIYDTFEQQVPLINRLLSAGRWDLLVTSFPAAVPMLEKHTGRHWHTVMQGVSSERFYPLPEEAQPTIAFSSYGRRWPQLHTAITEFCRQHRLHYDYTVCSNLIQGSDPRDNYEILAWHMRQSWFTVCWPVELTHPKRVTTFSPITCRWFEAAASAATVIGLPPRDPAFELMFGAHFVEEVDPQASSKQLLWRLAELWERRQELRKQRMQLYRERYAKWLWAERVRELQLLMGDQRSSMKTDDRENLILR